MFSSQFTESARKALAVAERTARSTNNSYVGTEHVLYALLNIECVARNRLNEAGIKANNFPLPTDDRGGTTFGFSPRTKEMLEKAVSIANTANSGYVGTEHLLLSILLDNTSYAVGILEHMGVNVLALINAVAADAQLSKKSFQTGNTAKEKTADENSTLGALAKFGVDLTQKARENKLDPVIGRSDEIERVIQILSRRTKNNPILIGEPGVGKSAIAEGLAQAIVEGNVPDFLQDKTVFSLDLAGMLAGTKYRGDFEERLKDAIETVTKNGNIVIFIDEIHNLIGTGSTTEGKMDAADILKPLLARGQMQTIGATTIDEYRKHIEKDSALERRFQPVMVNQPSVEDTIKILKGLRDRYEAHHKITITDEAIVAAAKLSDRYITDRFLPDKAIDLIDEASSRAKLNSNITPPQIKEIEQKLREQDLELQQAINHRDFDRAKELKDNMENLEAKLRELHMELARHRSGNHLSIGEEEIAEVVSKWTGIPVVKLSQTESERLLNLEAILHERVVGQNEAVSAVAKAIRRARAGLKDPKRPIGSFIFLGPTGVGKTELTRALAEAVFGDENLCIRLDMSEYMEKHSTSKLIGAPPGYVGYDESGQLTEKVRRKPYSVILFDEIEKAHPDVFNMLLQILDEGRLTDSRGRLISFKNTIIIMTSNAGASEIRKSVQLGFGGGHQSATEYENMRDKLLNSLKEFFKPEFLNRVDDLIVFHKLSKGDLRQIAEVNIVNLAKRVKENGITLQFTERAVDLLCEKGYDAENGARPLKRVLSKLVEDKLSEELLLNNVSANDTVVVDAVDGAIAFKKLTA